MSRRTSLIEVKPMDESKAEQSAAIEVATTPTSPTTPDGGKPRKQRSRKREKKTKEERREEARKRRVMWKAQRRSGSSGWCVQHAQSILVIVNVFFALVGGGLIVLGLYGTQTVWADMFGTGPGLAVVFFGVCTVLTAFMGYYGAKHDQKLLLLLYFVILSCGLLFLIIAGSIAVFDNAQYNEKFSGWWDKYPEQAKQGQEAFNCCGYANTLDRPAVPHNCSYDMPTATVGCKDKGLEYVRSRFVPLFLFSFISGVCMLVALFIVGNLVCRSTQREVARQRAPTEARGLKNLNKFEPQAPEAI